MSTKSHSHLFTVEIDLNEVNLVKQRFKQIIIIKGINGGSLINPWLVNLEEAKIGRNNGRRGKVESSTCETNRRDQEK